jgi:hypothetical protein
VLKTWRRLGVTPAFEKAGQNFLVRVGNRVPTIAVLRATDVSERAGQAVRNFIFGQNRKAGQNFLVRVGNRVPTIAVLRAINASERAGQAVRDFVLRKIGISDDKFKIVWEKEIIKWWDLRKKAVFCGFYRRIF